MNAADHGTSGRLSPPSPLDIGCLTMDFDEDRLYYSHQQLQTTRNDDGDAPDVAVDDSNDDDGQADLEAVRRHFREFLRK